MGAPPARRPPGGDLVPLARGSPRQALPHRAGAGLRLPARLPDLRLRTPPRRRAAQPARGDGLARRAGREPARALGPSARRTEAGGERLMARRAAAAAARPAAGRRAPVRRPPRRVSGPATGAAVALPGRVMRAPFARAARSRASGVFDALLQGRAWIALVAILLVGIVFFNVDLLELNRDIARTADRAARVKRENAGLRLKVARLASSERIQRVAARRGLELPAPGDVRYLRLHGGVDARRAAAGMTAPGEGAATPVSSGAPVSAPAPSPPVQSAPAAPEQPAQTTPPATTTTPPPTQTPPAPTPAPAPAAPAAGTPAGGATPAPSTGTGG